MKNEPTGYQAIIPLKNLEKSGFKLLELGTLTQVAREWALENKVFQYTNHYIAAYYKGDPGTTKDWVIVTDDGGFYKVGAEYMIWSNTYVKACWTYKSLTKTLTSILFGEVPKSDPDYQT